MLASMPNVLVVPPDRGFTSLQDLVRKVKAGPQKFVYGSSGNGSASHIAGEKFRIATGIEAAHIPYRGTPQALTDLMLLPGIRPSIEKSSTSTRVKPAEIGSPSIARRLIPSSCQTDCPLPGFGPTSGPRRKSRQNKGL